ncbi:MAG: nuclear transport factor 2 family protein [Sphingomonadaceae bacterium]|nr:nuclear transport factor 2 family protein [Sphingomonadaceae bacterium]
MMLPILLALAIQSAPNRLPKAGAAPTSSIAEQAVLAPINQLLAAFQVGDAAGILRLVYPEGRVTANGTLPGRSGLRQESWAQFAARTKPGDGWLETTSDPAIEIDGDVAMVWAKYVVQVGGKVSNCGFDHFDLVGENGRWKVMNLTFSSRTAGCPAQ